MSAISRFQSIRGNKFFEAFIIVVIMASALLIGVKTYDIPVSVFAIIYWLDILITISFIAGNRHSLRCRAR